MRRLACAAMCLTVALTGTTGAAHDRPVVIRGFLTETPGNVTVVVKLGDRAISCDYRGDIGRSVTLCTIAIPTRQVALRVEVSAPGYDAWIRNVFIEGDVIDVGRIHLRPASTGITISAMRLKVRGTTDFLIETVAENLTPRPIAIRSLTLDGANPWGAKCGDPAPPNPWQPLILEWHVARNPAESRLSGWTTYRGVPVDAEVQFRPANCGDYDHRLRVTVPLDVTIPASGVERLVLRVAARDVKALERDQPAIGPLRSLATWESLRVTLFATVEGTMRKVSAPAAKEIQR